MSRFPSRGALQDQPSNIHVMKKSARYRVRRSFKDFYQNEFQQDEILTFVEYHFLPYHGGYTVVFQERNLYLQEDENAAILNSFNTYFQQIDR